MARRPPRRLSRRTPSANTWNSREKWEALEIKASATPEADRKTKYRLVRAADTAHVDPRRWTRALYSALRIRNLSSRSSGRSPERGDIFMLASELCGLPLPALTSGVLSIAIYLKLVRAGSRFR